MVVWELVSRRAVWQWSFLVDWEIIGRCKGNEIGFLEMERSIVDVI